MTMRCVSAAPPHVYACLLVFPLLPLMRTESKHQSYACGVMTMDNECECICMEDKFVAKDEL